MNSFILSTDESLLLLEYEKSSSINELSKHFQRDPSVISRTLKKISEKIPVLEKVQGKWVVTELGRKFNAWTLEALLSQQSLLKKKIDIKIGSTREFAVRYLMRDLNIIFPPEEFQVSLIAFDKESEKLLLSGQVDFLFDCGKPIDPQIAFKRPIVEKMSVVLSSDLKRREKINNLDDLVQLNYIHYSRNSLAAVYAMTKDRPNLSLTVNDIALARLAVIKSFGWSILPTYTVKEELDQKILVEIERDESLILKPFQFGIWWNRDKEYLKKHIERALIWLKEQELD